MTLESRVRASLELAHRWWPLPGVAVCVVDGDGELLVTTSGLADAGTGAPVTPDTRFEIGSISKSFTSFALGGLADEGRLDLSASVLDYLPWLQPRERFAAITLRQLMSHTAGIIAGADAVPDAAAAVLALRDSEFGTAPGEFFHYSNVGYAMLGLVIERITGEPVGDVVTDRLLTPLGMRASAGLITHDDRASMATGYEVLHDDRPLLPGDPLAAAMWFEVAAADGNIVATASDMGRYARMLLGRGRLGAAQVVSRERFAEITDEDPSPVAAQRYALGLVVEQDDGGHRLTHGGGMVGYSSFLAVDMQAHKGVVVLTNAPGGSGSAEPLARQILAAAVGEPETRATGGLDVSLIPAAEGYQGSYGDGPLAIEVRSRGPGQLQLAAGGTTGRLYHLGDGRLGCDHPDWRMFPHGLQRSVDGDRWVYGPYVLAPAGTPAPRPADDGGAPSPYVGHYRSWCPWYPSFFVVQRAGTLLLIAGPGVEAAGDELELVQLEDGTFRAGADPRLPERLVFTPPIEGVCVEAVLDGCRYSRSFHAPRARRIGPMPDPTTLTLLHNPNCSTSVHALDALQAAGREVQVRRYLLVAERLDEAELRSLAERLVGDPVDALIRRDKKYKELGLDADGWGIDQVVATLLKHPSLLQRPILDDGGAAMIGRPRDRAEEWAATGRVA